MSLKEKTIQTESENQNEQQSAEENADTSEKKPVVQRVRVSLKDKLLNPSFLFKKFSDNPLINDGYLLQKKGRHDDAIKVFKQAIDEDKTCIEAHIGIGKSLSLMGGIKNAKKSIVYFHNALKIDATRLDIYKHTINLYERLGDKKNAAAELKKQFIARTLKSNPFDPKANNNLGVIQLKQGNIAAAIASFKKSIKKSPGFFTAKSNLANAYLQQAEKAKSEEDKESLSKWSLQLIDQVLDKEETAETLLLKAKILLSMKEYQQAAAHCDRSISKDPSQKEAFNTKRVVEERLGNIGKASQAYENYKSMNQHEQKEVKEKFDSPFE